MRRLRKLRLGPVTIAWADAATDRAERRWAGDDLLRRVSVVAGARRDAAVSRRCPVCGSSAHGAPILVDEPFAVSLGYAGSLAVAAAVPWRDAASVGVDVERADRAVGDLAALFAPAPPPDLAGWTRIEAVLKADGRGIRVAPSSVEFGTEPGRLPGSARVASPSGFDVATIAGPAGFVVSVAVATAARSRR